MTHSGSTPPENQMAGGNALVSEPASYSFNSDDTFKGMYGEVVSTISGGSNCSQHLQDGGKRRRRRTKKRTMKRKAKKAGKSKKARKTRSNKKRGRRTRRR